MSCHTLTTIPGDVPPGLRTAAAVASMIDLKLQLRGPALRRPGENWLQWLDQWSGHGDLGLRDGSFVLARVGGEWTLRQLARHGDGWMLRALHSAYREQPLPDLTAVHGVVIQKAVPGKRRLGKRYV